MTLVNFAYSLTIKSIDPSCGLSGYLTQSGFCDVLVGYLGNIGSLSSVASPDTFD